MNWPPKAAAKKLAICQVFLRNFSTIFLHIYTEWCEGRKKRGSPIPYESGFRDSERISTKERRMISMARMKTISAIETELAKVMASLDKAQKRVDCKFRKNGTSVSDDRNAHSV